MSKRLQLQIPDAVMEKLQAYCDSCGMTKQSYVSQLVSTTLYTQEQFLNRLATGAASSIESGKDVEVQE